VATVVLLVGLWSQLERFFVFFPTTEVRYTPEDVGLAYEEVFFSTTDGHRLHGWYVSGDSGTTLLWFHGNGGNIGHRVEELALVQARLDANVFIFDYVSTALVTVMATSKPVVFFDMALRPGPAHRQAPI